jgi:hypothetical protein
MNRHIDVADLLPPRGGGDQFFARTEIAAISSEDRVLLQLCEFFF